MKLVCLWVATCTFNMYCALTKVWRPEPEGEPSNHPVIRHPCCAVTTPLSRPLPQLQLCELPLHLYVTRSVTSWGEGIRHKVSGWAPLGRPVSEQQWIYVPKA